MKVAVIGSRNLEIHDLSAYLPEQMEDIVSGGARGVDTCAADYSRRNGIKLTEFLPDYRRYGRGAPLKRNEEIVRYADLVLIFWNGRSRGTEYVIRQCQRLGKPHRVFMME